MPAKIKLNKWKLFFTVLSLLFIALNIGTVVYRYNIAGWDFKIYCGVSEAYKDNINPYNTDELKSYTSSDLPFPYPPLTIPFLNLLCFSHVKLTYFVIWALLLFFVYQVMKHADKEPSKFFLVSLLITGFLASYWNYITGNIGIFMLLLFSLVYFFFRKEMYNLSAVSLSFMAFIKVIPFVYASLFLFTKKPLWNKIKVFTVFAASLLLLELVSFFILPDLTLPYFTTGLGKFGNDPTIVRIWTGATEPNSFLFMRTISYGLFNASPVMSLVLYLSFVALVTFLFFKVYKLKNQNLNFLFGMLSILLILPRFKPYTYTLAILPVYFLAKNLPWKDKVLTLLIVSVFPFLLGGFYYALREFFSGGHVFEYLLILIGFHQFFALLVAYLFLLSKAEYISRTF